MKKYKFLSLILCFAALLLCIMPMASLSQETTIEPDVAVRACFEPSQDTRVVKHKLYVKNIDTLEEQSFSLEQAQLFMDDFEGYTVGSNPINWLNTGASNSMTENKSLFKIFDVGGEKVFGTSSTLLNIHSHNTQWYLENEKGVEYSGRMMRSTIDGGIGITFYSHYPFADNYYRLRTGWAQPLHIAPHPQDIAKVFGTTSSDVMPEAGKWYRFRVMIIDGAGKTEIFSKAWLDEPHLEPTDWQVVAHDDTNSRFVSGTFGLWAGGSGAKYWDDLKVSRVVDPGDSCVVGTNAYVFEKGFFKPGNVYDLTATALDAYDNESVRSAPFRVVVSESSNPGNGGGGSDPAIMEPILPPGPVHQVY